MPILSSSDTLLIDLWMSLQFVLLCFSSYTVTKQEEGLLTGRNPSRTTFATASPVPPASRPTPRSATSSNSLSPLTRNSSEPVDTTPNAPTFTSPAQMPSGSPHNPSAGSPSRGRNANPNTPGGAPSGEYTSREGSPSNAARAPGRRSSSGRRTNSGGSRGTRRPSRTHAPAAYVEGAEMAQVGASASAAVGGDAPLNGAQQLAMITAAEQFRERPTMDITKPVKLMLSVHLSNQWRAPCCSTAACSPRSLFCIRCDIIQQRRLLLPKPGTVEMHQLDTKRFAAEEEENRFFTEPSILALLVIGDILTAGMPCGCFYHGMATTGYGCWTRWKIRQHYRVEGLGWTDFMLFLLFPSFGVSQHREEMALDGITPPSPMQLR